MEKRIRFSLDLNAPPTSADGSDLVKYGILDGETAFETDLFWTRRTGPSYPLSQIRLLPPCRPSKIVCVGRNYVEHANELGNPVPPEPLIFLKPPSALLAPGDAIVHPRISSRMDYEGELGVVIGRRARHVTEEQAGDYILGYTCVNDVTARDLQKKDGQWSRAKGFDTFCPVGPWIVPRGQARRDAFVVRTFLDGEKRQEAPVTDMIFSVPRIIAHVTQFMTLEPGDLIATGTPAGIGPMKPGSVVRVEIDGIGTLENRVVAE